MESRIDFHRRRKFYAIGLETNPFFDDIGTKTFPIEFLGGTFSTDIGGEKPNFISSSEFDAFVFSVVISCLSILRGFDCLDKGIMVGFELIGVILGGGILRIQVDAKVDVE